MKKLILPLIIITLLCTNETFAQKVKINCKVELNGSFQPDSIFVALLPTMVNYFDAGVRPPNPVIFEHVSNNQLSFETEPGIYMIGICAWKYSHAYRLIYVEPGKESIDIKFNMFPQAIGYGGKIDQIENVGLIGDFNGFQVDGMIPLEKQDDVWKLTKIPPELKTGTIYNFNVNGENTEDLLNDNFIIDRLWLMFNNVYKGDEIVFDPSVYGQQERISQVEIENQSTLNQQLVPLLTDLLNFNTSYNQLGSQLMRAEENAMKKSADSLFTVLYDIEKKYDPGFRQLFVEQLLEMQLIKLMAINPSIISMSADQIKDFTSGNEFKAYFTDYLSLINELDLNSYMLEGSFMEGINLIKSLSGLSPDILEEHNLSPKFFDDFVSNLVSNSSNPRLNSKVLYQLALMQINQNPDEAEKTLNKLSEYDYGKYIDENRVTALIARNSIKIGKQAPDFSVTTLDGKKIKLSDYKGKFVFIDFWGSWCSPCLREIPNIKNFYSKVSRDKLEIIGLAGGTQETEEKLRKCIADNEIEYPNSMASPTLLATYGINKFPTSYLINPNGRIIRIDMRGEDELDLIADEIDHYFK